MDGHPPRWFTEIPLKLRPLKQFDFQLVQPKLDGLLFNIVRDLQKRVRELSAKQQWHESQQLVGLSVAALFTKNSYNSVRYLVADTPEDHQRKPNYVLVVPAINRQLLDLLFTL